MPESNCVLCEETNNVLTLTLNQSEKRNALSYEMLERLQAQLLKSYNNPGIRVVVIAAKGPVFSAGHDLKELEGHRSDPDDGRIFFKETMNLCSNVMQAIINHPRPVIAKVRGMATAAGCQLVASCDLAISNEEGRFGTPGVNIGLFCSTPMVALSRKLSRKDAMQMLLLGEVIDARTAQSNGLINKIVPNEKLDDAVAEYCRILCEKSAVTLAIGKEAFYRQSEMPLAQAYNYTSDVMVKNMLLREAQEGMSAFIEKRAPQWKHE